MKMHPGHINQRAGLAAKVVDDPEEEAKQETSRQREGDCPVAAAPGEVSRKAAERDVKASEA